MTLNLSTVVQTHPLRAHLLPRLLPQLTDPAVVTDPAPTEIRNPWRCYRACLQAIPDDATHLLIVQDDALPCPDFAARAALEIRTRPGRIICFFVPGAPVVSRRVREAVRKGNPWVDLNPQGFVPVVATSYPADTARAIVEWADALDERKHTRSDDYMISLWCRKTRTFPGAVVPSLVEHDAGVPSLIGNSARSLPGAHRVAFAYVGDGC